MALLWLAISSTLIISVSAVHFHPQLDKEQLSAASFETATDTISDEESRESWPTTQQAFRSDVTQLHIAWCVDAIVPLVNWRRYSEHFFI